MKQKNYTIKCMIKMELNHEITLIAMLKGCSIIRDWD